MKEKGKKVGVEDIEVMKNVVEGKVELAEKKVVGELKIEIEEKAEEEIGETENNY